MKFKSINKVLLELIFTQCSFVYILSSAAFAELRSCNRDSKPKIFIMWLFTEKVCYPQCCMRIHESWNRYGYWCYHKGNQSEYEMSQGRGLQRYLLRNGPRAQKWSWNSELNQTWSPLYLCTFQLREQIHSHYYMIQLEVDFSLTKSKRFLTKLQDSDVISVLFALNTPKFLQISHFIAYDRSKLFSWFLQIPKALLS